MYNSGTSHQSPYARTLPPPPPPTNRLLARHNIPKPLMRSSQWSYSGGLDAHAYPSPPMTTSPTSPKRQQFLDERQHQLHHQHPHAQPPQHQYSQGHPHEHVQSATSAPSQDISRTSYMASQVLPAPSGPPPYTYGGHYPPPGYMDQHPSLQPRPRAQSIPPYQQSYPATAYAQSGVMGMQAPPQQIGQAFHGPLTVSPIVGRIPKSGSRRAKAHVARACANCKKAHLSCDEQRPCSRCVANRRESSCIDVEHKKRGRPRIQPERGPIGAQRGPPAITPPSAHLPAAGDSSWRLLRSQHSSTTDRRGSLPVNAASPQPYSQQQPYPYHPQHGPAYSHPHSHAHAHAQTQSQVHLDPRLHQGPHSASADITSFRQAAIQESRRSRTESHPLVLFLNMNFSVLKVLEPLRALIEDRVDLKGATLESLLHPKHHDTLVRMKAEFRDERYRREPNMLPSLFSQEQETVSHLTEVEIPQIIQDSSADCSDMWTFVLPHGRTETFHCRVRLAKTEIFFLVVEFQRIASTPSQPSQISSGPSADLFERRSPFNAPPRPPREMYPHASVPAPAPVSPFARSEPASPYASLSGQVMTSLPHGSPNTLVPSAHATVSPSREPPYSSSSYFPRQPGTSSPGSSHYPSASATALMQPPPNPSAVGPPAIQRSNTGREMRRPEALSNVQLPPILSTSAPTTPIGVSFFESQSGTAPHPTHGTPIMTSPHFQQGSSSARRRSSPSEDTTDEEASRKRRRLDIGEIIEK